MDGELAAAITQRQTRPACDGRRQHPEEQEGCGDRPGTASVAGHDDRGNDRESDAAGHLPVRGAQIEPGAKLRLSGGDPLEQAVTTHQRPHRRSRNGVRHQPCLMREQHHLKYSLQQRRVCIL